MFCSVVCCYGIDDHQANIEAPDHYGELVLKDMFLGFQVLNGYTADIIQRRMSRERWVAEALMTGQDLTETFCRDLCFSRHIDGTPRETPRRWELCRQEECQEELSLADSTAGAQTAEN